MSENETIITEVRAQLETLNSNLAEATSEARLVALINQVVEGLAGKEEFQRKMRFGSGDAPAKMLGTKYARHGLGIGDIEWLYDYQMARRGQGRNRGPSQELTDTFNAVSDAVYMTDEQVREIDKTAIDNVFPRIPVVGYSSRADRELAAKGLWHLTSEYKRAMDTAESGYGSQLIGAQYVGELWDGARQSAVVMPLINEFEMNAPTAYLPVAAALPEMYYVSESTANNSSNFGTVKTGSNRVTVTASKFVIHQMWSGEMEEDSIIPFVPFLRTQVMNSMAYYGDSLVINGDTTNAASGNINLYDADPADTKHYLAQDGLRHAVLVDNTGNATSQAAAAPTWSALYKIRTLMLDRTYFMDWGHPANPADLVYVVNPELADKMVQELDELITVDKYGPQASVLTGQVTKIGQNPVVSTIAMPNTETTGFVINSPGTTYGTALAFNRNGYVIGWRRRVKMETERIPATDQDRIVYSMRLGFGRFTPTGAASGIESAAALYYIAQ